MKFFEFFNTLTYKIPKYVEYTTLNHLHTLASIIVTLKPNDCSCLAAVSPDIPAPITIIFGELLTKMIIEITTPKS